MHLLCSVSGSKRMQGIGLVVDVKQPPSLLATEDCGQIVHAQDKASPSEATISSAHSEANVKVDWYAQYVCVAWCCWPCAHHITLLSWHRTSNVLSHGIELAALAALRISPDSEACVDTARHMQVRLAPSMNAACCRRSFRVSRSYVLTVGAK